MNNLHLVSVGIKLVNKLMLLFKGSNIRDKTQIVWQIYYIFKI